MIAGDQKSNFTLFYYFSSKKIFEIVASSVKVVFLIIMAILFWMCISTANEFQDSIVSMQNAHCSSDYANSMFRSYGDSLISSRGKNYTGLITASVSVLLTVVFFFMEMAKKTNVYQRQD
jgi:Fe2+ transport system protein B